MSSYTLRSFATRAENPLVFMDFAAGGKDMGRIVFEVEPFYECVHCSFAPMLFQRQLRTSDVFVLVRRELVNQERNSIIRVVLFIVLFLNSCVKWMIYDVVIL